ncbi:hypothetical protein PHMEG_00013655 [Phytophthora megakarya]|uniref:Uncharacterized protein n=1 Tax=Phytophthora megakarya TaxID=4795 RepID=A0A225W683_9STRA|nr:hypothetical protein PHMEG_00013655 [Phytophthora megakarya]
MHRYQADKLQRWAMVLTVYRYVIEHISGENNVWADILSRWKTTEPVKTPVSRLNVLACFSVDESRFPMARPEGDNQLTAEYRSPRCSTVGPRNEVAM